MITPAASGNASRVDVRIWHGGLAVLFARPRLQRAYRRLGRLIDRVAGSAFSAVGARFLA